MRKRLKPRKPCGRFLLCLSSILFLMESCGVVAPPIPPEDIGIEAKILAQKKAKKEEKFKEAGEAYDVLSNAETRKRYDMFGHSGGPQGFGGAEGFGAGGGFSDVFGDIFEDFFGGGRGGRSRAEQGNDLQYNLELTSL